jgi:fimbrial isopeptide formation D2 family protein
MTSSKFPRALAVVLPGLVSLVLFAQLFSSVRAQTLGGTTFVNQASSSYTLSGQDQSSLSNTVEATVPGFCTFLVTPNGTTGAPARTVSAIPGATEYVPYTLTYTGNVQTTLELAALRELSSTLLPAAPPTVILDSDGDGLFDTGEGTITDLAMTPGSVYSLLVAVTLRADYTVAGTVDVNLRANCLGESNVDEDNVSRVNVLRGGVTGLRKTAVPGDGSTVDPGETLTYRIGFTVNEVALDDVFITDTLDDALEPPSILEVTVNGFPFAGVTSYDAVTKVVRAELGSLQPDDEVVFTITTRVLTGTLGGVVIDNTATLGLAGSTIDTNTVTHTTPASCLPVIKPDGTLDTPAFSESAPPGSSVVFPYSLSNLGNVVNDFLLEAVLTQTAFPATASVVVDVNDNGAVDAGETPVTRVADIAIGAEVKLLLVVTLPSDGTINGDVFANLIARCALEPTISDQDNISNVSVPNGGIRELQKSSEPASGTLLYPGATLSYFIDFAVNGRDLSNVVVTDVLDARLIDPVSLSNGIIRDDESGLTTNVIGSFDVATRTVTWRFASIPSGMNVRLELVTGVRADATPDLSETMTNTATLSADDISATETNTVVHELNTLEILLSKVATPQQVFVGDTLTYTLTILNPQDSISLRELVLTDDLPEELRYKTGSSKVTLPEQGEQAIEPSVEGQRLTWILPGIARGEQIVVTIETEVLATATQVEELVNTAEVVASDTQGRAVADAAATANTIIEKGVFTAPSVLLGTVFEDLNANNRYDEDSDSPVEGVRVYLSDGRSVVSDKFGRYTFLELRAGIDVVKVDLSTLPARLLSETTTETRPGLWRVRLEDGLITRQDVPLLPPGARIAVTQYLNVVMGGVRVVKCVVVIGAETTVILKVTSDDALTGLTVQDVLPQGVSASEVVSDDMTITFDNLTFNVGDVPAGYQSVIQYRVDPTDIPPTDLLLAPVITWQVRP